MWEHNLNSLNPGEFANLLKYREDKIAAAAGKGKREERQINKLSKSLHPKRQELRVAEVIEHGENCKSYILVPDAERGTAGCAYFSAGQYLSVFVDIDGNIHSRPYSIVSSPKESLSGKYQITVKAEENGLVSSYIIDHWREGTAVEVSDPMGTFTYEPLRDASHIIGIAGGSGITPFLSLGKAIADGDEDCSLTLFYGSITCRHILFKAELDKLQARCPRIRVIHVLSDEHVDGYLYGYISAHLIRACVQETPYSVFVCGPRPMVSFMDEEIEKLGLERKYIRHELHGELLHPTEEGDYPQNVPETVKITVLCRGVTTDIFGSSADSILRTLEKSGIRAPSRCRSGECGFCRTRLVSGTVYIPKSMDMRRKADNRYGYIHPCCTYPLSALVVEIAADNEFHERKE